MSTTNDDHVTFSNSLRHFGLILFSWRIFEICIAKIDLKFSGSWSKPIWPQNMRLPCPLPMSDRNLRKLASSDINREDFTIGMAFVSSLSRHSAMMPSPRLLEYLRLISKFSFQATFLIIFFQTSSHPEFQINWSVIYQTSALFFKGFYQLCLFSGA